MRKKTAPKADDFKVSTTEKDRDLMRMIVNFDDVNEQLLNKAFSNESVRKTIELINWTRNHALEIFNKNYTNN